jgi:hypothetical protein
MNSSEPHVMPDLSLHQAMILITACWLPVAEVAERMAISKAETCEFDIKITIYMYEHMHKIKLQVNNKLGPFYKFQRYIAIFRKMSIQRKVRY